MREHYRIIRLQRDRSLWLENHKLVVDLDSANLKAPVVDDDGFSNGRDTSAYYWISGGGTYVINGRYFVVVKRNDLSRVNSGKFSLFTGRSESLEEWLNPRLLVRELFEELLLFRNENLLLPRCASVQETIDSVYHTFFTQSDLSPEAARPMALTPLEGPTRPVQLTYDGKTTNLELMYNINDQNDINVLNLFALTLDLDGLTAQDGESHRAHGTRISHGREVFLLDLFDSSLRSLSAPGSNGQPAKTLEQNQMTGHLAFLAEQARGILR